MKCIKVFGAEVSGSKFLIDLLKLNTQNAIIFDHEFGHSNGIPLNIKEIQQWFKTERRPNQSLIRIMKALGGPKLILYPIVIIKNPYLWYKNASNFRGRKNVDISREFEIYNSTYNIYKDLLEHNTERYNGIYKEGLYIRYEELLAHPETEVNRVAQHCGIIARLDKDFKTPDHVNEREKKFYIKGPPWKLNEIELLDVQTRVDWELMKYYGYRPINIEKAYNTYVRRI